MASLLQVMLANGTVSKCDNENEIKLDYSWGGINCFQCIPGKAVFSFARDLLAEAPYLLLVNGFSIDIDARPTAIAFNEIKFLHSADPSLNFNLPLGLVRRIVRYDSNNSQGLLTPLCLNFRFSKE